MKFTSTLSIITFNFASFALSMAIRSSEGGPSARNNLLAQSSNSVITCTNNTIDYVEAQHAAIDLGNYCAAKGPIHGYTKSSAVDAKTRVYVCNWSPGDNTCDHDAIVRAQNAITATCGLNRSGMWYNGEKAKSYGMEKVDVVTWCEGLDEQDPALVVEA